jgi:hypothetical protein
VGNTLQVEERAETVVLADQGFDHQYGLLLLPPTAVTAVTLENTPPDAEIVTYT